MERLRLETATLYGRQRMRFYRVSIDGDDTKTIFLPTLKDAHVAARDLYKPWRDMTYIDEVEVKHDKEGFAAVLCKNTPIIDMVVRSWGLTPRGGLKEVEKVG